MVLVLAGYVGDGSISGNGCLAAGKLRLVMYSYVCDSEQCMMPKILLCMYKLR